MKAEPVVLATAVFSLLVGLGAYAWRSRRGDGGGSERAYVVSWLLISLFPVLLIFSFFPQSEFSAGVKGATATGAVALFVFLWWYGTRTSRAAATVDRLRAELAGRTREAEELRARLRLPSPIEETRTYEYVLDGAPDRRLVVITGDLRGVKGVDVWVNSENTDMQMCRFHETSISAIIRYEGARRDPVTGRVVEDLVADELRERLGGQPSVEPGTAVVTGAHGLAERYGVMGVVHAAAVHGTGAGYGQVGNLAACVRNALTRAGEVRDGERGAGSVLLPILGAGTGGAPIEATVRTMVNAIVGHLSGPPEPRTRSVYLLAHTDAELAACERALEECERLRPAFTRPRAKRRPRGGGKGPAHPLR
ncbi:macro domain-containing protein [Nonomuraea sp. SMC257]|uniref:Macro domain-containing protein n=1 Tax=Nonomuraea montanisoli TaxID=2741721 RepID=A0A7Y6I4Q2_9ACTN|nr:macro domain-containing protein [Nonomuraea montanisoli]NUW31672.1 macro domain-containing protein [Nonomuraea montanisoli]